jgi:hypothetical protein
MSHFLFPLLLAAGGLALAASTQAASPAPDGWQTYSVRDEIAPRFRVVGWEGREGVSYGLALAGRGNEAVDGRWQRTVPVAAGQHYAFSARYQAKNVANPERSILARLFWLDAAGKQIEQAEYPMPDPKPAADGQRFLHGVYRAPERAAQARGARSNRAR